VGPDEAEQHGPYNGYTSLMARRSLEISSRWWTLARKKAAAAAQKTARQLRLTESEIAAWSKVAENISIPEVPGQPGVPLQDAFFLKRRVEDISNMTVAEYWKKRNEVQVIKQADVVLAMYLCEDEFTREEIKRGYEFYEPKTLHVSSLSLNTHAIVAAIIGHEREAYDYFRRAAGWTWTTCVTPPRMDCMPPPWVRCGRWPSRASWACGCAKITWPSSLRCPKPGNRSASPCSTAVGG
jgi:trehalose/maltose hydrolase-like predicted phosphorylase